MKIERCEKSAFAVVGKEGSTADGPGFIQALWQEANAHFAEVEPLAKKDAAGRVLGIWGVMSDFSRSFRPWEDGFTKGLYLAGVECSDDAEAPDGWTKWIVPGYEYLVTACEGAHTFTDMLAYLQEHRLALAGAVHDFHCPIDGRAYMCFPIRRL